MTELSGKVALVTGAASGIGAATAQALAAAGADVVLSDIQKDAGAQQAAKIVENGGNARFLYQDVAEEAAWQSTLDNIIATEAGLDILINNAGIADGGLVQHMRFADWRRLMAINLDSVFLGMKYAIPLMRQRGGGAIVNISSIAGLNGAPGLGAYCASKGGVRLLTKAAAVECAQMRSNIRINSVHPGIIDTPIWANDGAAAARQRNPALPAVIDVDRLAAKAVPMGQAGTAQDVANCICFLASDAAAYVTGAELVIDGGMIAGSIDGIVPGR